MSPRKLAAIRLASSIDVPRLVELNRAAYPDLVEDGVVWSDWQLHEHQQRFPRGQLVAESEGTVSGAIATLILPRAIDPLAQHTWVGVTDGGTFSRHDATGDTLYLADVYVDPACWGRGVGSSLYAALRATCRDLGLARVVAGGRLWSYGEVAETMSPNDYVARVIAGELHDQVLISQLRAGFVVRGLLPGYLHDFRSRHWATLLEWVNPDVARGGSCALTRSASTPFASVPLWRE